MQEIELLEPWTSVSLEGLEAQLKREVQPGHPLYSVEVKALARRLDCDDVLFGLINHPQALAVVHLTYETSERNPQWPHTVFYNSLDDWIERCMTIEHEEYLSSA